MEDAICRGVPVFALLRESGKQFTGPHEMYTVKTFSHGLHFDDIGAIPAPSGCLRCFAPDSVPPPVQSTSANCPPWKLGSMFAASAHWEMA